MKNNLLNIIKNRLLESKTLRNTLRVVDPELLEAQKTIIMLQSELLKRKTEGFSLKENNDAELIRVASDAVSSTKIISQSFLELMDQNKELRAQKVLDDLEIRRLLARPLVDNSLVSVGYTASGILSNLITIAPVAAVTGMMVIKFVYGMDPSLEGVANIIQTVVEVQPIPDIVGTVGTEITVKR